MNFFLTVSFLFSINIAFSQQIKWINAKSFGMIGNGISDNAEALEALLNFNNANKNVGFILPEGRYFINKHFYLSNKLIIKGEQNSTLIMGDGIAGNLFHVYSKAGGTRFLNITFDSEKNNSAPELLRFDGINNIEFSNCKFLGPRTIWFNNVKNIIFKGNSFSNKDVSSPNSICNFVNSHNIEIYLNSYNGGGGAQFMKACSNVKIKNNTFKAMTAYPIHFVADSDINHKKVLVSNNKLLGNGKMAFHGGSYDQVSCFRVENLMIVDNTISAGGDMGITLAHCRNAIVYNNLVTNNNTSAISIINVFNCLVENNRFEDNGTRISNNGIDPKARAGIYFYTESLETGCDSILIYNNKISFLDKSKKYYTLAVNGSDKKFIKIYSPGSNRFPQDQNYTHISLSQNRYENWRKSLFAKTNF